MYINVSMLYLMVWFPNLTSALSYVSIPAASNAFGFQIYKALTFKKGNMFFSPLSTHMAVTMAYMGSRKGTAQHLVDGLFLPLGIMREHVGESYKDLLMLLQDTSTEGALNFASKVFVDTSAMIEDDYRKTTHKYFFSEAMDVDFYESPELALLIINEWVQTQTMNKIKDILQEESVSEDTRMVLVSALYLGGSWAKPFRNCSTIKENFQVDATTSKTVHMMHNTGYYFYVEDDDCEVLSLEYADSDIVMLIMLPKCKDGLENIENKLLSYDWDALDEEMANTHVEVYLPRFQIEKRLSLSKVLNETGLTSLFVETDFRGISCKISLKVDDVVHKAIIDVNEEGFMGAPEPPEREHGRVTSARTTCTPVPKQFKADHPFFFLIRHEISKAILFMGRFCTP